MPVSPARAAACDILVRVDAHDAYASELLHASHYAKLSRADHALATELVMGVLRWRSLLDEEIAKRCSIKLEKLDPEVLVSLRLAAYQFMFLDRIPTHAVVHESVELVKRARKGSGAAFVNAVLRKLTTSKTHPGVSAAPKTALELSDAAAHPKWLVERWIREFGFDFAHQICSYDQKVPQSCIRLTDPAAERDLEREGIKLAPGNLLASARRVVEGDLSRTRPFREGQISVQDEASQLVALLVGEASNILDCCAAPGGKTRVVAERNPSARILAVEIHPHRARLLRKLVQANNVHVIAADARHLPTSALFDRVLADVPCSGTGTLARNPDIKWRLKADDLLDLQARQLAILQAAMQRVAPGGRLIYSTCSLEKEENVEVVEKVLSLDHSFRVLDFREQLDQLGNELVWTDISSLTYGPYLRTIPGVHPCDGFFAAVLEKI